MDTVIGNKYIDVFNNLDIEVSKKLEGEFDVEEIVSAFDNFFFNKMFLDITSIKDYRDLTNLQKLSMAIDMDKVILLLDEEDNYCDSEEFLSKLVSIGIYNFTKDKSGLMYLYNNPNSYRDVAYYQDLINDNGDISVKQSVPSFPSQKKILGIKNVTDSAGSTTLTYMIKKVLSNYHNVMALELNRRDLTFFHDKEAISIREDEIENIFNKYSNVDYFIVDLDNSKKDYLCSDVLYLVEPSTIKLNKLLYVNSNSFKQLDGKKIVFNKSLVNNDDIKKFEEDEGINIYYNIIPLNDKEDCSSVLVPLLQQLGYIEKADKDTPKKSIFNLFR